MVQFLAEEGGGLAHVLLQAPVEAALVNPSALVVVGAGDGAQAAHADRARGAHEGAVEGLGADGALGFKIGLAAVHLVLGVPAPVPAAAGSLGDSGSWEAADTPREAANTASLESPDTAEASAAEATAAEAAAAEAAAAEAVVEASCEEPIGSSPLVRLGRRQDAAEDDDAHTLGTEAGC